MFFQPLRDIANKIINLDPNRLVFEVIRENGKLQEEILDLNRVGQLFDKGINSNNVSLISIGGGYAQFTIQEKQRKGQPTDRVTLKDTGEFYRSFRIKASLDFFEIDANGIKDDTDLFKEWGEDILGLTDESKLILSEKLIPLLQLKLINSL